LYAGVVRACGGPARGAVEIPICLGTEIGVLQAQGIQLALPRNSNALWIAAAAGVRPRWVARPRFALGGAADLVVPLIRHSFATVDAGPVHRVAPVAARLGILVEVRLP
jgi:hypothetical protein